MAKIKNLFIHPQEDIFLDSPTYRRYWMPLEFLNAISLLKKDGIFAKLISRSEAKNLAKEGGLRFFVSTSPLDLWQSPSMGIHKDFFHFCQDISKNNEVCVSGYHGTLLPELMLKFSGAQVVIRSEPEETIRQISSDIPLDKIRGVTFKKDNQIIRQSDQAPCDLKKLPIPAYDQIDFNRYCYELLGWRRFALFETSRGCKYNCNFCSKDIMYGQGFRQKTFLQVRQELETAIKNYNAKAGYIFDLDFLSDRQMAKQICEYLIEQSFDFQWCCQTRIDEADEEILRLMARAGCRLIHYGIESLKHLQGIKYQQQNIDTLNRVIQLTKSLGIKTLCFYIIGFRYSLYEEDRNTLQIMHKVNSSYIVLHRYYNFYDRSYLEDNITKEAYKKNGKLEKVILFNHLFYYLHPLRIRDLIIQDKKIVILRAIKFFLKIISRIL